MEAEASQPVAEKRVRRQKAGGETPPATVAPTAEPTPVELTVGPKVLTLGDGTTKIDF